MTAFEGDHTLLSLVRYGKIILPYGSLASWDATEPYMLNSLDCNLYFTVQSTLKNIPD